MIRQTAFGIALSTLVLASGLTGIPVPGKTFTQQDTRNQPSSLPPQQVAASTTTFKTTDLENSVFEQINRYRVSNGLSKLSLNANITKQARIHSRNMAKGKVAFSHHGFEKRVNAIPIKYNSAAENVAYNLGYNDPASEAVIGWLNSPGHLHNIKGNYNLTGIGVATNSEGEVYLTQIFLRSRR
jgi:uncharacterized protein YkwD